MAKSYLVRKQNLLPTKEKSMQNCYCQLNWLSLIVSINEGRGTPFRHGVVMRVKPVKRFGEAIQKTLPEPLCAILDATTASVSLPVADLRYSTLPATYSTSIISSNWLYLAATPA